jgi:cyanophycinase
MLAYGKNGATPRQSSAQFVPGLGFTNRIIFDQHFRQRDRLGRLLYAVANHPGKLGVGVDENTAAVIEADGPTQTEVLTVIGQNAVTIVDGRAIEATDVSELKPRQPVAVSGVRLHVLTHGCTFHLPEYRAHIPEKTLPVL